jgi:hypothetical protein
MLEFSLKREMEFDCEISKKMEFFTNFKMSINVKCGTESHS